MTRMVCGIVICLFVAIDVRVGRFEISYFATWVVVWGVIGVDVRNCGGCGGWIKYYCLCVLFG